MSAAPLFPRPITGTDEAVYLSGPLTTAIWTTAECRTFAAALMDAYLTLYANSTRDTHTMRVLEELRHRLQAITGATTEDTRRTMQAQEAA